MLKYYDPALGRHRYKRRYIWGLWAGLAGFITGVIVASALI